MRTQVRVPFLAKRQTGKKKTVFLYGNTVFGRDDRI